MNSASHCYINFADDVIPTIRERNYLPSMVFGLLSHEDSSFELDGENIVVTGVINYDVDTFILKRNDDDDMFEYKVIGIGEKYW